jgi:hypothetical protein
MLGFMHRTENKDTRKCDRQDNKVEDLHGSLVKTLKQGIQSTERKTHFLFSSLCHTHTHTKTLVYVHVSSTVW